MAYQACVNWIQWKKLKNSVYCVIYIKSIKRKQNCFTELEVTTTIVQLKRHPFWSLFNFWFDKTYSSSIYCRNNASKIHIFEWQKDLISSSLFSVNKLRGDEVQLKDALVKLQSLNEALGQDKVDLNRIIQKVEVDRDTLSNEKQELDMEKSSIKEVCIMVYGWKGNVSIKDYLFIEKIQSAVWRLFWLWKVGRVLVWLWRVEQCLLWINK